MTQTITYAPQLKFNKMSQEKYESLKEVGELIETEFYVTPDYLSNGTVKDDIGNIVLTTKLTLSDGENWCDGSVHTKSEFPEYYDKLVNNELASVDFTTFDENPACGVSGLDTESETFKFPKIEDVYIKIGADYDEPYGKESLPNITGELEIRNSTNNAGLGESATASGAFQLHQTATGMKTFGDSSGNYNIFQPDFDASRSSETYQDDAKVNPDHITLRAYVISKPTVSENSSNSGLEIGDIGCSLFVDESQNLRRYLNGQVISQSQFQSFTTKLKNIIQLYPTLATTEENWQAEVTNSKLGQCGKFVIDDELGTIRLPKVVNINGLQELTLLGGIKNESLPNITGNTTGGNVGNHDTQPLTGNGALYQISDNINNDGVNNGSYHYGTQIVIDASRSSSTYQNNASVQQEAVLYPYFIQVATGIEESVDVSKEIQLNNPFSLLDYKWSEYEITNASWLISNGTFHSGTTYTSVYQILLKIYNGTEIKSGVSVKLSTEEYTDYDFVLNTTDTTFRLPVKVKLASGSAVAGNGIALGLTNGTDERSMATATSSSFYDGLRAQGPLGVPISTTSENSAIAGTIGITTDPEKSGIETSSQGLKLYFYVGETMQDVNIINANNVLTRINELNDEYISGLGFPSNRWIDLPLGASNAAYTAPANGYVVVTQVNSTNGLCNLYHGYFGSMMSVSTTTPAKVWIPVKKGDTFFYQYSGRNDSSEVNSFKFYYANGEE